MTDTSRYEPDDLGRYSLYDRNGKQTLTLGPSAVKELKRLGVSDGEKVVAEEHEDGVLLRPADGTAMTDGGSTGGETPSDIQLAHDLTTYIRAEGYSVGFDPNEDVVTDFPNHKQQAASLLKGDDVSSFFLVVERDGGNSDYSTSVIVQNDVVWGVSQIQMLGAHFRTVLDALPLSTTDLVSAIVDEALTIDEDADDGDHDE